MAFLADVGFDGCGVVAAGALEGERTESIFSNLSEVRFSNWSDSEHSKFVRSSSPIFLRREELTFSSAFSRLSTSAFSCRGGARTRKDSQCCIKCVLTIEQTKLDFFKDTQLLNVHSCYVCVCAYVCMLVRVVNGCVLPHMHTSSRTCTHMHTLTHMYCMSACPCGWVRVWVGNVSCMCACEYLEGYAP